MGCEGIEPLVIHLTFSDNGFTIRREEHNPEGRLKTEGLRLEEAALSMCPPAFGPQPIASSSAPPTGFEPVTSTLTGWRALQTALRGRKWHRWESNPQAPRFELGRFAGLRTMPRQAGDCRPEAEGRCEIHPAGCLPGSPNCGGRNRTCVVTIQSRLPVPAQAPPHRLRHTLLQKARGGGVEPPFPGSKPGGLPLADPRSQKWNPYSASKYGFLFSRCRAFEKSRDETSFGLACCGSARFGRRNHG